MISPLLPDLAESTALLVCFIKVLFHQTMKPLVTLFGQRMARVYHLDHYAALKTPSISPECGGDWIMPTGICS